MGIWGDSNDGEDVKVEGDVQNVEPVVAEEPVQETHYDPDAALRGGEVTIELSSSVNQFKKGDTLTGSADEDPIRWLLASGVAVVVG
jgi:hypothetical protein